MRERDVRIGAALRKAREDAGLTQNAAATAMGFTRPNLSQIESGKQEASQAQLIAFAALYAPYYALPDDIDDSREDDARYGITPFVEIPVYEDRLSASMEGASTLVSDTTMWVDRRNLPDPSHRVFGARVKGNCLAPRIEDGDTAVLDMDTAARPGDTVYADIEGEPNIKIFRRTQNQRGRELWVLSCNDGEIAVEPTRIRGVVVYVQKPIPRG